jgi:hypothetical protein
MKKIILLIFLCSINTICFSQEKSKTVMVKSIETYGSFMSMNRNLYIVDEKGGLQTIELEKHNTKGIPKNIKIIKKTLDKYLNLKYKLISSNAVSFGWNGVFTIEHTYIFEKKDD